MDDLKPGEFIKSMPVWEHVESFSVEVAKIRHGVQSRIKEVEEQADKIPQRTMAPLGEPEPKGGKISDSASDKELSKNCSTSNKESNDDGSALVECLISDDPAYDKSLKLLQQRATKIGEEVYAMIEPEKPWVKCRISVAFRRPLSYQNPETTFRLKLPPDYTEIRDVGKLAVAWTQNHQLGLRPSKRVIAGHNDSNLLSGIVGNVPNERSKCRYLVHFDNGSAGYFEQTQVYPIIWQSETPWKDPRSLGTDTKGNRIHMIYNIMGRYPKKTFVNTPAGSFVCLDRNGMTLRAKVLELEGAYDDIMHLQYTDGVEEYVYRGSTRVLRKQEVIARQLMNRKNIDHFDPRLIYFITEYSKAGRMALGEYGYARSAVRNQTARKSTVANTESLPRHLIKLDENHVPDITDDLAEQQDQSSTHRCNPDCLRIDGVKTESSVSDIVAEFRRVSDLKVPLMLGWKRIHARVGRSKQTPIFYKAPCGRLFKAAHHVRRYLADLNSKLDIDYFCFDSTILLNPEVIDFEAVFYQENLAINCEGRCLENKFISVLNLCDRERIPLDFTYCEKSMPHPMLAEKGFSFNTDFKSGCDCDNDCYQRASCPCHILNEQFSGKYGHNRGDISKDCQYTNKRLNAQVATGIFECNSLCKCSSKCANRVVQNGIRFRLQVHRFPKKGWGVITLDDIPNGAFICTYAAELLDDADQYGDSDMYYADLDYISINENRKGMINSDSDEGVDLSPIMKRKSPSDDEYVEMDEEEDDDVRYMPKLDNQRRYPARNVARDETRPQDKNVEFKKIHNILGSHDYTLDARMRGNLGRFLNHCCEPNSVVQNVFIETHDLRFPIVAFFATQNIAARDEITWDYNYKMGSIEGRSITCHCGKPTCRKRIL